jgi:hypothetical protein
MRAATFWLNHSPSNSRVLVEFDLYKNKVYIASIYFVRGNVVDINAIRKLQGQAKQYLLG